MPIGRECVSHYRDLSRYCVFSHDEMVCNMVCKADTMDVELASAVQKEMTVMVREEEQLRGKIDKMVRSLCPPILTVENRYSKGSIRESLTLLKEISFCLHSRLM